jgi:WD40 repeat protein
MRRAAFSSDSKYVIVTSLDGTARLWDTATGDELHRYAYPDTGIEDAALSPDGKWVLLGLRTGTARLAYVDYRAAVRDLCARLTRDFTDDERSEYHILGNEPTCP